MTIRRNAIAEFISEWWGPLLGILFFILFVASMFLSIESDRKERCAVDAVVRQNTRVTWTPDDERWYLRRCSDTNPE